MKKSDLREKIHLTSVDELFGLENAESRIEIAIDRIRSFKDHPFKVQDDEKMADLAESIKANGVLTPVLVRENVVIKPIQIAALRERAEKENIDQEKMIMILHNALPGRAPVKKVVMNEKKLRKYFPEEYTSGQMEQVIEALLEQWSREQKGVADGI